MIQSPSSRSAMLARMKTVPLVPVIRASSPQLALSLARALHEGGLVCLEITLTVPQATQVIAQLRAELGDAAIVGAGTVTSRTEALDCLAAGAQFLVSPGIVDGLVEVAHAARAVAVQGALSPTEVMRARAEGADVVKLFPCSALGGPNYLRALAGPFPQVPFMPSGGVQLDNITAYLQAGASLLGLGGALADERALSQKGSDPLRELAAKHVALVRKPTN
jgi:2-dehydro-3-deoxyphosphogluconate aldolase / (4S)-4-hydroxy-2-oxoglutarate aldolase